MLKCHKCGAFLETNDRFCCRCGAKVPESTPAYQRSSFSIESGDDLLDESRTEVLRHVIEKTEEDSSLGSGVDYSEEDYTQRVRKPPEGLAEKKDKGKTIKWWIPMLVVGVILVVFGVIFAATFLIYGLSGNHDYDDHVHDYDDYVHDYDVYDHIDDEIVAEEDEPLSVSLCGSTPYLGSYHKLEAVSWGQSSYLQQEELDFANTADMALDNDEITSWQEGVYGDGIGESIWFEFPQEQNVKYLSFKLGNWRDWTNWIGNNRPSCLMIMLGDYQCAVSFPNEQREFWVELSESYPVSLIRIRIDDVYEGDNWDDTCIAEIGIYGE